ncbi:hypothetical protein [Tropicibacter oceani]|uniref:HEPN domain-containing protein n=1 Tax=Tropicibacter oceani TaxID=3058420 RepID=A0ABY8QML4_9RHOB|nr:hypothetical protein [Tropicibacter oceani]WGW05241.1 hypothetical protein QF118_06765 [Tropicibacter oceani]
MNTEPKTDPLELSVGFFIRAQDFATSARHLNKSELSLRTDAPEYLLLAHALELVLKAHLLALGETVKNTQDFGHDLKALYDAVRQKTPEVIRTAEKGVRRKWIDLLKKKRDLMFGSSKASDVTSVQLKAMGYISNEDIGALAPAPMADLEWLSERHKFEGSIFRYFKPTIDAVRLVTFFDLSVQTPFKSNAWLVEELVASFPYPVFRDGQWHMISLSTN